VRGGGSGRLAHSYARAGHDAVRQTFERGFFARLVPSLLTEAGGGRLLDLGSGDALMAELADEHLTAYVGVDLDPPEASDPRCSFVAHDLGDGLAPVGEDPFDVYLASFGLASHLTPDELRRLLADIAAHARPGSMVALEALGLFSLEWPRLWDTAPGPDRVLSYRLGSDVPVHPWAPDELSALMREAGIEPLRALDRTIQAGPKTGEGRYWPGLPPVRAALSDLLGGDAGAVDVLRAALPPLPAHPAAEVHYGLALERCLLLDGPVANPAAAAAEVWNLDPASGAGYGHGLTVVGRVPA
jgi:hypothetical protein